MTNQTSKLVMKPPEIAQFVADCRTLIEHSRTFYEVRDALSKAVWLIESNMQPDETSDQPLAFWKAEAIAANTTIRELRAALVYACHAQHSTHLHMLPPGITLYNDDGVKVERDGYRVYAGPSGMREAHARGHERRPVETKAPPEFTGFVRCTFDGGEPVCSHEGYSGLSKDCPYHGSAENGTGDHSERS